MKKFFESFIKFIKEEEDGATATEYVIIIALIALALYVVISKYGASIAGIFKEGETKLDDAKSVEH